MKFYTAEYWIDKLKLEPHPEGGFYKETYRAAENVKGNGLPPRFDGDRSFSTAIYFLLRSQDRSLFHRIKSDELWHFYTGSSITIHILSGSGYESKILGSHDDGCFQIVVPARAWFGAHVNEPDSFVLAGCTVAPGFDFRDFEMAERAFLLQHFPDHEKIIHRLTK